MDQVKDDIRKGSYHRMNLLGGKHKIIMIPALSWKD
jgi:hypothetical protein